MPNSSLYYTQTKRVYYLTMIDMLLLKQAEYILAPIPTKNIRKNGKKRLRLGCGSYLTTYIATKKKFRLVHRLVALVFLGECPIGQEVRHLDGDPKNNKLSNLMYGSKKENAKDRDAHGKTRRGETMYNAKLTKWDVKVIRDMAESGYPTQDIHRRFPVTYSSICNIIKRKSWAYLFDENQKDS